MSPLDCVCTLALAQNGENAIMIATVRIFLSIVFYYEIYEIFTRLYEIQSSANIYNASYNYSIWREKNQQAESVVNGFQVFVKLVVVFFG